MAKSDIFSKPLTAEDARARTVWSVLNNEDTVKHIFEKVRGAIELEWTYINDNKIADILREFGYSIEYNQMYDNVKISWYEEDSE